MNARRSPAHQAAGDFVTHLRWLALERPGDTALIVAAAGSEVTLDYAELDLRVRALAARLQSMFEPGERILLLLDNDEHYVVGLLACMYAGMAAVPAFPPESVRPQHLARLRGIAGDAQARCALTSSKSQALLAAAGELFGDLHLVSVDAVPRSDAERWRPHRPVASDIAFLQYTSGSTATPKGVIVDHGNLLANQRVIQHALQTCAADVFVSWLPLFHDMGLIGGLCQPLYCGIPLVLASPASFLERPVRWLQWLSRHRGTISGGPDFAYRLCVERVTDAQLQELDLSSWRVAFSGAEPVRDSTMQAFAERFAPAGFDARAGYPCYGLAEATLFVTGVDVGDGVSAQTFSSEQLSAGVADPATTGTTLVACGTTQPEHCLRIVDPASGGDCSDAQVGEIWVSGPSVSRGYWRRPEQTSETFVEREGVRWLRTGDLGFLRQGQLYVAGRLKDLIILRGHNIYPQDIELAIESAVEVVRKGRVAAFAVETPDGEGIGVAVEVSRGLQKLVPAERLFETLNAVVSETCREPLALAVLLNPGGLPKTSSGKVQRSACREGWRRGSLDAYAIHERGRAEPAAAATLTPTEKTVAEIWRSVLRMEHLPLAEQSFFALGGNSVSAAQMLVRVADQFGIRLTPNTLFAARSMGELAAQIERARSASGTKLPSMTKVSRQAPLPLSAAQQRMRFLWQLHPESAAYNVGCGLTLRGALDRDRLCDALNGLIARHEVLRTRFPQQDATAVQEIQPAEPLALTVIDLTNMAEAEREARAAALSDAELGRPFNLQAGPIVRATLLVLAEEHHRLLLVMHHIAADGASMVLLVEELASLYTAPDSLPPPAYQYADYAAWQQAWLDAGERERQLAYWSSQLPPEYPDARPRFDRVAGDVANGEGRRVVVALDDELVQRLRALAREHNVTLFIVLLAAWKIVLARHSGHDDIRVGAPLAGRRNIESEAIIGPCVNTVVLRSSLAGSPTAVELLQRVAVSVGDAQAHQDLPFEHLVEVLAPQRSPSRQALFDVIHNHQRRERTTLQSASLQVQAEELHGATTRFDLALNTLEQGEALSAAITYRTALYEAATIDRIATHWRNVLQAMAQAPSQTIDRIRMLDEREIAWLVHGCNDTVRDYGTPLLVHERIERQAAAAPEALAVICDSHSCTYRELNRRANRLARMLREKGVGPDVLVAICGERSMALIVGLVAIMKSGGAYLPLDPEHPAARLAFIIESARPRVLLAGRNVVESLPASARRDAVILEDVAFAAAEDGGDLRNLANPLSLAYCLYTSGSTGEPKCAANTHAALLNQLLWRQDAYGMGAQDRVLHKTPLSFDVSVWEVFWPLMTGATLIVAAPGAHRDPWRLHEIIREHRVTTLHFVPPMLSAFLEAAGAGYGESLRHVFVGGQALPAQLKTAFFGGSRARLHHLYGPTEAAIDVSYWECRPDVDEAVVPIGHPIANTQLYVLDPGLQPAGIGIVGELYIGGVSLARGYLQQPGLTASRFIASPFAAGARMYRTGDLARYRADGALEFVGRSDHQVKVRGFRIEAGEVEACLRQHGRVRDAVVLIGRDRLGEQELIACVACERRHEDVETKEQLERHLAARLPDYMMPARYVLLNALPLLTNGKVDRAALAKHQAVQSRQQHAPPRDDVQKRVAAIWSEVLQLATVGLNDNFFELGGHSLLATKVIGRVRREFDIDLQLLTLFEAPRLEGFAQAVRRCIDSGSANEHGTIDIVERGRPWPLSHSQQRMWTLWVLEPDSAAYNLSGAVELTGPLDANVLHESAAELIRRHETLRTTFELIGGVPAQRIHEHIDVPLTTVDLGELGPREQAEAVSRHADEEGHRPFDLVTGPLLRLVLLRLASHRHVLIVTTHHVVAEGWAIEVFARELMAVYTCLRQGQPIKLPRLPVQYVDYAQWQLRWLQQGELDRQLSYWTQQLAGGHEVLALPTDRPRPRALSTAGAVHRFQVEAALAQRLRAFGVEQGTTLFMTLLAGFFAVLHRHSGQEDLRVGVPVANRVRPEAEGLIGAFLNTQVMRCRLADSQSWLQLLAQVRQTVIAAQSHQDLPFDRLVETLKPPRSLAFHPLFQVMFNLHRWDFQRRGRMADVEVEFLPNDVRAAKLDLMLDVGDLGEALDCCLTYSTELFDQATVERLMQHWVQLLAQMVEHPQTRIGSARMLTEWERNALLECSETASLPPALPVHRQVERVAKHQPNAIALVCSGREINYSALNASANRLAHRLIARGVGPEVRVAVAMERSIERVVALLAVLKAGGCYVPLDPGYPQARLDYMLQDSCTPLLLTQRQFVPRFASPPDMMLVDDADWHDAPAGDPGRALHPELPAYTIYTSGSTGRPKGVVVRHGGLSNFLSSMRERPGLQADDVLVAVTSLSFDIAALEIFLPLVSGARVVIADEEQVRDGAALAELLDQHRATVLQATPSGWRLLLAGGWCGSRNLGLRGLCGGEPLPSELAQRLADAGVELWNMYGPTETTIWSSTGPVNPAHPTLGRPISATRLHVLTSDLQPAAIAVAGELYIGGAGLARGYLHRGALTAERFVADPFDNAGARLYRTGDQVRWTARGELEFLSRSDQQLKIRGFRIEPGEIETQLLAQPEISQAAVVGRDSPGGTRLIAYVVQCAPLDSAVLRDRLACVLPDYMVPASVVVLDSMPLTDNGKLDRKALPEPDASRTDHAEPPQGGVETLLAQIWSRILQVPSVSRHDNFFELGGDSILTVRIVAEARAAGWSITPRQLFERQTIAALAAVAEPVASAVERPGYFDAAAARIRLQNALGTPAEQIDDVYPLTPLQQGMLFHSLRDADGRTYVRQLRVDFEGLDVPRFVAAWRAACERHEMLRTGFIADEDPPLQWVRATAAVEMPEPDVDAAELNALAAAQLAKAFDLARPPLMRFVLARVDGTRHHFIWTHHHLLTDGWSAAQLLGEIVRHYQGQAITAPRSRFRDYVDWLRGRDRQAAQSHWLERLRGLAAPTLLSPAGATCEPGRFVEHSEVLDAESTQRLERFAKSQRVTLNTLVQAGWACLLARHVGRPCVVFGVTTAGRPAELIDVERLVGLFINTYPMIAALDCELEIGAWLRQLQDDNVAAREHDHTPLQAIQRWAGNAGQPLFDTLLVFENYPIDASLSDGADGSLRFSNVRHEDRTHYPLTITAIGGDCLSLRFSARANAFEDGVVSQFARELRQMLRELTADAARRVGQLLLDRNSFASNIGKVPSQPKRADTVGHSTDEAPREGVEAAIAAIWSDVLRIARIGRQDDFFLLGGDSILAMSVVTRIRRELHGALRLSAIFEHRTLAGLSALVAQSAGKIAASEALVPVPRTGRLPLSPAQMRLWIADRLGVDSDNNESAYVMSAALELEGALDVPALHAALQAIVARHEVLRTCYPEDDGDPFAQILPELALDLPIEELANVPSEQQPARLAECLAAQRRPFDLATGPLLRASLVRLASSRHVLILAVHHIAFDGWSQSVFVRELADAYVAASRGTAASWARLPIQYVDYAAWHARKLAGPAFTAHASFWRNYLHGAPAVSTFAADFERPPRHDTAGDCIDLRIEGEVLARLRELAQQRGTTLFTLLYAAFSWLMHRQTNAADLVIGTDVAGREHPDLEALLGFFVNVVPLRSTADDAAVTLDEWLRRIHVNVLTAFEHQDLPFDQIVELAGVPRARDRNPLVQVLFVLQNVPPSRLDIPELEVTVLPAARPRSKFDLAVFVQPDGQVAWVYSSALYLRSSVQGWAGAWLALLRTIALAPDPSRELLPTVPVPHASVRTSLLREGRSLPLVVTVDDAADPARWAEANRNFVDAQLRCHGAVLFRDFPLRTVMQFETFAGAIEPELFGEYGDLPKQPGGRRTYRSTPYPADKRILFHNESSHLERWPSKQWFFCEQPATAGGATPIVDCRRLIEHLPAQLVDRLERLGLLYVRTFTASLDVDWREFFKTDSKDEVSRRLRGAGIEYRWLDGEQLQTRTRAPAVIRHPVTGERVLFNQLQLHHPACLEPELREDLLMIVGPERLPRNVLYGDGSVIDDTDVELVGRAYEACAVRFEWRQGDVLMLDNTLAAHGRDPYEGPRKIVVAMGAMVERSQLETSATKFARAGHQGGAP